MNFQEAIEEIKARLDLVEVIQERVELKRVGNRFRGLCPFHRETHPSFYVDPEKGIYHCFGCKASGNIFTFVMKTEGLDFKEAVLKLSEKLGIKIDFDLREDPLKTYYELMEDVKSFYVLKLFTGDGKKAMDYLLSRGISRESIEKFQIGYAPVSGLELYKKYYESPEKLNLLKKIGLIAVSQDKREFDFFRNRIIFPVSDFFGRCVGFGGRSLEEDQIPKYLNTPESEIFRKGRILYALDLAKSEIKRRGYAILVEGYIDVIMMHQIGFTNTVAPMGTSFTENQAKTLKSVTKKVVVVYDGDEAGINSVKRIIPILLKENLHPEIVLLPEKTDPAQLASEDPALLMEKLSHPINIVDFVFSRKFSSLEESEKGLSELGYFLSHIEDSLMFESYLNFLTSKYGIETHRLERIINKWKTLREKPKQKITTTQETQLQDYSEIKFIALSLLSQDSTHDLKLINENNFKNKEIKNFITKLKNEENLDKIFAELSDGLRSLIISYQLRYSEPKRLEEVKAWLSKKRMSLLIDSKVGEIFYEEDKDKLLEEIVEIKSQILKQFLEGIEE